MKQGEMMLARLICWLRRSHAYGRAKRVFPDGDLIKHCRRCGIASVVTPRPRKAKKKEQFEEYAKRLQVATTQAEARAAYDAAMNEFNALDDIDSTKKAGP